MENEALKRLLGITRDKMVGLIIWLLLFGMIVLDLLFDMGIIGTIGG